MIFKTTNVTFIVNLSYFTLSTTFYHRIRHIIIPSIFSIFVLLGSHFLHPKNIVQNVRLHVQVDIVISLNVACTCRKVEDLLSSEFHLTFLSKHVQKSAQPLNSRKLKLPSAAGILKHSFKERHFRPNQKPR